jgi:predicted peroxiredoxin
MNRSRRFILVAAVASGLLGGPTTVAFAGNADPLFINLTSDDAHRVEMALSFGGNQLKRGHHLTVFMNDRAVLAASKANAEKFPQQQKEIAELVAGGAKIFVCHMCMKHFGVGDGDLLAGLEIANPDVVGAALFEDGAKTLGW